MLIQIGSVEKFYWYFNSKTFIEFIFIFIGIIVPSKLTNVFHYGSSFAYICMKIEDHSSIQIFILVHFYIILWVTSSVDYLFLLNFGAPQKT